MRRLALITTGHRSTPLYLCSPPARHPELLYLPGQVWVMMASTDPHHGYMD